MRRRGCAPARPAEPPPTCPRVLDDDFCELERLFEPAGRACAASSHAAAIDCIEAIVQAEGIQCDFERVDGLLVAAEPDQRARLEKEADAMRRAGFTAMQAQHSLRTEDILIDGPALRFPRQAAFHVGRYMHGLARAFTGRGGHLVFDARAVEVKGGSNAHVRLDSGARLGAQHIVVATNTPFNDRVTMHTKQAAYRTYVVGFEVPKDSFPGRAALGHGRAISLRAPRARRRPRRGHRGRRRPQDRSGR